MDYSEDMAYNDFLEYQKRNKENVFHENSRIQAVVCKGRCFATSKEDLIFNDNTEINDFVGCKELNFAVGCDAHDHWLIFNNGKKNNSKSLIEDLLLRTGCNIPL
jgi:isocitrate lyase